MQFAFVPPGDFTMGSPQPGRYDEETQHPVRFAKPFFLSVHEVTQQQYEQVMTNNPNRSKGANKPVQDVTWAESVEFCRKLSDREGEEYRLPTEDEWEYACRAGTSMAYSFGDDDSQLGEYA